ncbi:MAG: CAP domain-containing protein [Enterocloster sp.]
MVTPKERAGLGSLSWIRRPQKPQESAPGRSRISFSHTRPDGRDFSTALSEAGASFRVSGENIAYGQRSAEQVMDVWMNSAGHRANILNPGYSRIGIGHVKDSRGVDHWVQLFLN